MGTRRRGRAGIAAIAGLGLLLAACGGAGESEPNEDTGGDQDGQNSEAERPEGEPIVIGMDEDSTGPGASYGVIAGNTVRDAIDQINAEGGILDRPVDLVVENDESDPTKTPAVIRKLVDQGAHALVLSTGGGSVLQAKSVALEAGVPAIAPVAITTSVGLPPDEEYTFMLANGLDDYSDVYCGAADAGGIETMAVLGDDTAAIDNIKGLLLPGLEECVEIVADETAPGDSADLSAQVARIREEDPDSVLITSVGGGFEVLAHNVLAQQLPEAQRFSLASIGNQPDAWELADPGALEGVVYMGVLDDANENTQALTEFLQDRRGDDFDLTGYDAQAYDTVQLIKLAIEAAENPDDQEDILDQLNQISSYEASFGQPSFTISFTEDKHIGADSLCGLVLTEFGEDNTPVGPWEGFQPPC